MKIPLSIFFWHSLYMYITITMITISQCCTHNCCLPKIALFLSVKDKIAHYSLYHTWLLSNEDSKWNYMLLQSTQDSKSQSVIYYALLLSTEDSTLQIISYSILLSLKRAIIMPHITHNCNYLSYVTNQCYLYWR